MEHFNGFQKRFLETLAVIQESCVQSALCQRPKDRREDELYSVTSEVILRMLEVIDGYADTDIGRLDVICEKTGTSLKKDPFLELHDAACAYLKGVE